MKSFLHQLLLLTSKIVLGCILGCIMLLFYASHSHVVKEEIKKSVQRAFKEQFDCDWDGNVELVDLFALRINFSDVSFLPCNKADGWSLYTDTFDISASLLHYIIYRHFRCHAYFEDAIVYEKQLSETSHFSQVLGKMFAGDLPTNFSIDYITIKQGQVVLDNAASDGYIQYYYNCQMSKESDGLHTQIYILDGNMVYKNTTIFEQLLGNVVFIYPYTGDLQEVYARADCRLNIPALQEKSACFLVGDIYATRGAFVVSNEDQSFIIEPLKIRLKPNALPFTCSISMESDVFQRVVAKKVIDESLTGNITLTLTGNLLDFTPSLQGILQVQHVFYKNNQLFDAAFCTMQKHDQQYNIKVSVDNKELVEGVVSSTQEGYACDITNVELLPLLWNRYWSIPQRQGKIIGTIQSDFSHAQGSYHAQIESLKLDAQALCNGSFIFDAKQLNFKGTFVDTHYEGSIDCSDQPHISRFRCYNDQETFIDFYERKQPEEGIAGFVGFNFIKNLVADEYKSSFSQPGRFDMQGNLYNGSYHAQVMTNNAHIRIPSLYNVLQQFTANMTFDVIGKSIIVDNMMAHLYEGTIHSNHAVVMFDQQAQFSFLSVPLFLDHVLMSWNKGIFGIVSGRLCLFQQLQEQPILQGNLIIDKAQLKGNIFSQEFQDQLVGAVGSSQGVDFLCNLDVGLQTKEPVMVETSFLQAMVHLDLQLTNTLKKPDIAGTIDIVSGELKFPYKSLFITHGQIMIMPQHSTEPTIEFEAKGKIKRYDITMRATGTMMDQNIHFESSPYLTEEQIVSLLLAGSHDSALSAVMQAMFMQRLHEIIFGPAISKSKLDLIFNRLLQSFKNIRIFPQFTNQTGRGGVRGVIEIDATDRLHGRIDSNLMQLEDTIFEADYLVTDDVTIRAIKDGPSTYGGEVEMRWKFS